MYATCEVAGQLGSSRMAVSTSIVFVVDDDISVRESLELLTRHEGWQPQTSVSAQEFLTIRESVSRRTFLKGGNMDHNEALRKFEHLMLKQADHAQEAATELEALVSLLPHEKPRQLAELQVKASHKQAKDFRELAQKVKER